MVAGLLAVGAAGCAGESAEGRRWIHDVEFKGVQKVDKGDLKEHIALSETSWVPLSRKHYLEPLTLPHDRQRIEAYYAEHGYFHARVKAIDVLPRPDGESTDVRISVDEGLPSRIRSITFDGIDADSADGKRVLGHLPLHVGKVFAHQEYLDTKHLVEGRLKALGHAWVAIAGTALVNRDDGTVDVKMHVDPGPLVRFGDIEVVGDTSVNLARVKLRVPIDPGDRYDPELLESTRGRIYNLGLFSSVKVEAVKDPARADVARVRVTVAPGTKNELRLGMGLGIDPQHNEAHLKGEYTRRNFLGGLRTLNLRLVPGWAVVPNVTRVVRNGPTLNAEARLTQPDFVLRDLQAKVTLGYDLGVDYAFQYHGPRLSVGFDHPFWRERITTGISYNYQYLFFFNTDPEFLGDPTKARQFYGYTNPYRLAYFQEDFALDLRDKPLDPRKGAYFRIVAEEGANVIGGGFDYEKLIPDIRAYCPFGPRVRLATRVQYGRMWAQGDNGLPITRRLYAGGAESHRGFGYNRLAPQVPSGIKGFPPIPIGGDELLLAQAELRVDVHDFGGNWFGVVAFWDAGDVPENGYRVDLGNLHHAVGGGLRLRTVIGTIRADLGYRLNRTGAAEADGRHNPDPGDSFAFHISLGEAF